MIIIITDFFFYFIGVRTDAVKGYSGLESENELQARSHQGKIDEWMDRMIDRWVNG
jgi:hypothetical protein